MLVTNTATMTHTSTANKLALKPPQVHQWNGRHGGDTPVQVGAVEFLNWLSIGRFQCVAMDTTTSLIPRLRLSFKKSRDKASSGLTYPHSQAFCTHSDNENSNYRWSECGRKAGNEAKNFPFTVKPGDEANLPIAQRFESWTPFL